MREIKFDAFIQIKNPEADELEFEHNPFSELLHEGFILFKDNILTTDKEDEFHKTIIREFTGLKDKNGREIYEGDQLYNGKGYYRTAHFIIGKSAWFAGTLRLTRTLAYQLEVIGNIYENSELIK